VLFMKCKCGGIVFAMGKCKSCYMKDYSQSDAFKESQKKYSQSDAFKESRKKYRQSDAYKESQKKYRQSDAYKESQKKYSQSDAFKESQKKYRQSDAYKESRKNRKVSLHTFVLDFFEHFTRKIRTKEDLSELAEVFSKNACELSGREQCRLEEMILIEGTNRKLVE